MTFLITGASRGIGLELTKQSLALGNSVTACVRDPSRANELKNLKNNFGDKLDIVELDVTSDDSVKKMASEIKNKIDVLINNAGVYLDARMNNLQELTSKTVLDTLQTNTLGPLRVTRAMIPNLSKDAKIINITSLMGSISDNAGGGAYAYRMSKTALNMFSKCLSIEFPGFTVLSVHPGWVQTDMGGKGASVSVPESAKGILNLIKSTSAKDSAKFYDYRGRELSW